jgi:hypothetical protein
MSIDKEAVPDGSNIFHQEFHIGHVENLNPAATTVVNNYYYGTRAKPQNESLDPTDRKSIREEILHYVERTIPHVDYSWKDKYMALWADILDLTEVSNVIYDKGRQEGSRFNWKEVCHILCYLGRYANGGLGIFQKYVALYIANSLDEGKAHTIRPELGFRPSKEIQHAIDKLMKEKYTLA